MRVTSTREQPHGLRSECTCSAGVRSVKPYPASWLRSVPSRARSIDHCTLSSCWHAGGLTATGRWSWVGGRVSRRMDGAEASTAPAGRETGLWKMLANVGPADSSSASKPEMLSKVSRLGSVACVGYAGLGSQRCGCRLWGWRCKPTYVL
jgi:hypothetical protein